MLLLVVVPLFWSGSKGGTAHVAGLGLVADMGGGKLGDKGLVRFLMWELGHGGR
jgi:hypothetical protein